MNTSATGATRRRTMSRGRSDKVIGAIGNAVSPGDAIVELVQGIAEPSPDDIARRAYELFEARGGEHGHDVEDWLEAQSELKGAGSLDEDRLPPMPGPHAV